MHNFYLINLIVNDSDSDDDLAMTLASTEDMVNKRRRTSFHRGSIQGRAYIVCDRVHEHLKLLHDYFRENPIYFQNVFRRRFRMNQSFFLCIQYAKEARDPYFVKKKRCFWN